MSPRTLCAIMIWEAWKHVRKAAPGPKSRRAAEAAEAYWRATRGEPRSSGEEPLAFWRHHFKKAAASRAVDFRTEVAAPSQRGGAALDQAELASDAA
jgi:hypothetical protein